MHTTEILTPAPATVRFQVLSWSRFTAPGQERRASIVTTTIPADAKPEAVITARWPHAAAYRPDVRGVGPWMPLSV